MLRRRAALLTLLALAGCETPPPPPETANPNPPPPPPRVETIPKPPVSEDLLVWQPGHWEWAGTGYVWQAGEYVKLDGHTNQYMPGYWDKQNGAWVWLAGHWL
jgi:hypothetical protein